MLSMEHTFAISARSLAASEVNMGTVRADTATLGSKSSFQTSVPASFRAFLSFASLTTLCSVSMLS